MSKEVIKEIVEKLDCDAIRSGSFIPGFRCKGIKGERWNVPKTLKLPNVVTDFGNRTNIKMKMEVPIRNIETRFDKLIIDFAEDVKCTSTMDEDRRTRGEMRCSSIL